MSACCQGKRPAYDNYGHSLHGQTFSVFTALKQAGYTDAHFAAAVIRSGTGVGNGGGGKNGGGTADGTGDGTGDGTVDGTVDGTGVDAPPPFDTVAYAWALRDPSV
eukprot:CAMPEP_0197612590 /NCGR_PEP_ID=MMETSP1326-20131121/57552_1 /TAXON_ID=1155430 /ORGANISM="Genus nov. species nov., Strain RCC2288" /LENGTH=105 /DNA_ID=CAMNT_0043181357 /DNA_START=63 /DNA_END=377 /DNA_ORIENTATION=-